MASFSLLSFFLLSLLIIVGSVNLVRVSSQQQFKPNYVDALVKGILFFEGQRSGDLPPTQRMKWRKSSALHDGHDVGVDLTGGYYDAGDNVKFNFPMAFTTTVLAWSVIEFGDSMGTEQVHVLHAIRWATDYFLKCTSTRDKVYVQVGEPYNDHLCWERPEDMDTDRTAYAVDKDHPGSEVSAEIAAALAASSIALKTSDPTYSARLIQRAIEVFNFADKYRGSYNDSLGSVVCPFYCDWSGYQDELLWGASWLYKATNNPGYWDYVQKNIQQLENDGRNAEFGWDDKHAGIYVMTANELLTPNSTPGSDIFRLNADKFVCTVLPESPTRGVEYSQGGLLFKTGNSNMQRVTAISFLLLTYSGYLSRFHHVVKCGDKVATPDRIVSLVKDQVDYILGKNPLKTSYMVGYGDKFPQMIHHRGSVLPSIDKHPQKIGCHDGTPYFKSKDPNPNLLIGAVVGGPDRDDTFPDNRLFFNQTEPTTYINAPLIGVLAFFSSPPNNYYE